jgi:hypothetical protein
MAGQSAMLPLSKAKAMAKGAGKELGESSGGTKACAPVEGKELGKSGGKKKQTHNY